MNATEWPQQKIFSAKALQQRVAAWHATGRRIVFTNGCFDILHRGHISYLSAARSLGDVLVVGLNTDASVSRLKGPQRPVNAEGDRAFCIAALMMVDAVCLFGEDTPLNLIEAVRSDVLVKGGDYTVDAIVGAKEILARGGRVEVIPFVDGYSTTGTIERMQP